MSERYAPASALLGGLVQLLVHAGVMGTNRGAGESSVNGLRPGAYHGLSGMRGIPGVDVYGYRTGRTRGS